MNDRWWLRLLLIVLSLLVPARIATAQPNRSRVSSKQSHHDLPGGLDLDNPQEMMAQRLRELHELHELQDQVAKLLKDPELLKSIRQLPEQQLQELRDKMLSGQGLEQDGNWKELLQRAASRNRLDQKQIDILHAWAKRAEGKQPSLSEPGSMPDHSSDASSPPLVAKIDGANPTPSLPPANPPEPSFLDRMQEESTKWLLDHLDDVGDDVLEALTDIGKTESGAPLAGLLRSLHQPAFSGLNLGSRVEGFSRYVPKVSEFLHEQRGAWNEVRSLFRKAPVPSLPRLGAPSVPRSASLAADSEGWTPALLLLLLLGMIVLLLCRMSARSQARVNAGADPWRLGPWPVSPEAVSSRQDVVRAFEYLALLRLGVCAAACHHRELAERLAEQDSGSPKHRQAAEMLAWLYEQARYAPDGETLSPEELSDARHALCCLAGVTAL